MANLADSEKRSPEEHKRLLNLHNSFKPVWLTETVQLGPWLPSDRDVLVEFLNDPRVYPFFSGPPYPYTLKDADAWLALRVDRMTKTGGTPLDFAFRDMARGGKAVGCISISNESDDVLEGDDIGYWLAPDYRGLGLMAKALKIMLYRVSVVEVGKRKFNAHAFVGNYASRKTLEKVGFVVQENMSGTIVKDGKEIPRWVLRLYLTDEDVARWGEEIHKATPIPLVVL
ncbi:hypothetical protein BGZ95_009483 [Linnemannia exigua]|uniref:N-acetyltransferase domain-containing protein n=1 Tax=Linnemannia exigua TaxID=604196 RepID=A0AAD4H6Q0_9FUNG|nr:hypothetical protein BGZ95_009483 [Linnemannia exigua]